jgi:2-oxoglutarate dehydrogenase E2 component (dihydrolipoamide succinyltransferase)
MGESVTEGTVTRWLVAVGDKVERDQPLVEVSTDKVDAEIPSPTAGVVVSLLCEEGDVVPVGGALVALDDGGEAPATELSKATEAAPAKATVSAEQSHEAVSTPVSPPASDTTDRRAFATPVARKIAARHGLDLSALRGSGIRGRITRADVEAAIAGAGDAPAAETVPEPAGARGPRTPAFAAGEEIVVEPMSRIRRLTAQHMSQSQATSVHVTTVFHVDFSHVVAARERTRESFAARHGTKLTYMPFIFKALADALQSHAKFNASIDGTDIVYKRDINLGMAVALDHGLIVPVIRNAERLDLVGLAQSANDLAERARTKKLRPDEIQGGTFTVTNPGVFGSLFGTPIIHQPQVAILCVGAIEKRVIVETDELGNDAMHIRPMCYFALTYDHRLIDGADAELFMLDVKRSLGGSAWPELGAT